jgi:hypothetical protein
MVNVPVQFISGDRIVFYTDPISGVNVDTGQSIFMQPPNFTLSFAFRGAGYLDVTAVPDGDRFKSIISSADSSALEPGILTWQGYVTDLVGDRTTVGSGQVLVIVNLAGANDAPLTQVQALQTHLDKVEAAISARLTGNAVVEYEINGRKLKYVPLPDLTQLRDTLKKDLFRAQNAALSARGQTSRRRYIRFDGAGRR